LDAAWSFHRFTTLKLHLAAKVRYNTIPQTEDAGIWAGQALAFLCRNFSFFTLGHEPISLSTLHRYHLKDHVTSLLFLFCFDKSPRNFCIQNFAAQMTLFSMPWQQL
jgi:hypothetical protein